MTTTPDQLRAWFQQTGQHTDDCVHPPFSPAEDCRPMNGVWMQPPGMWVDEARMGVSDDAPWCRIREVAFALASEEGEQ